MIKTKCLNCGIDMVIDYFKNGDGYFFGHDSFYYGDCNEDKDPHTIIGYYCDKCGTKLEKNSKLIGWKRID